MSARPIQLETRAIKTQEAHQTLHCVMQARSLLGEARRHCRSDMARRVITGHKATLELLEEELRATYLDLRDGGAA